MAWDGYFKYDDVEIINAERTEAYAEMAGVTWFRPQFRNEWVHTALGEDVYEGVELDGAPWFDERVPYSKEFYGAYPLDITGLTDSTQQATIVEGLGDGGVVTQSRSATKSVVFNLVLIAASEAGAEYGTQWLKRALSGNRLEDSGCTGGDLVYFASEPHRHVPSDYCSDRLVPLGDGEEVTERLSRTLRRVKPTVGLTITSKRPTTDGGAVWQVQFTLTANNPFEFSVDVPVVDELAPPRTNWVKNPSFEVDLTGWTWTGCVLTRSLTQSIQGDYSGKMTATGGSWYYAQLATTSYATGAPGEEWMSGIWVYPPRDLTIEVMVAAYTSGNVYISNHSTFVAVSANEWTWVQTTAMTLPATTAKVGMAVLVAAAGVVASEVTYIDGALLDKAESFGAYFDGDFSSTDNSSDIWAWSGTPHASISTQASPTSDYIGTWTSTPYALSDVGDCYGISVQPIYDPLFPAPVAPPPPPGITWENSTPPEDWMRTRFTIPEEYIPRWSRVEPIFSLAAPLEEARNIRVRIYPDPLQTGDVSPLDPCDFVADFMVSYIPAESTLVIDTPSKSVYVDTSTVRRRADALVLNSAGGVFRWPQLSSGQQYVATVDMPVGASGSSPLVSLSLVGRSD